MPAKKPRTNKQSDGRSDPWRRLTPAAAEVIDSERERIVAEIVAEIAREIPAYTRPLDGAFGETVRGGVDQALRQFAAMARGPSSELRETGRRVYAALGRGEMEAGRSIGALLAAYRLGAQVAWRRLAAASLRAKLPQQEINLLAEAIFAYIDTLSAESAEGYAAAQAEHAGELDARRLELIELLTRGSLGADRRALARAAEQAAWRVPDELAVVVWREQHGRAPGARLPQDSIYAHSGTWFVALVPDPRGPERRGRLTRGLADLAAGMGSVSSPAQAPRSYRHALAALALGESRGERGLVAADANRAALITGSDPLLAAEIREQRLAPLAEETANSRDRLEQTLLAWLRWHGNIAAAAAELHVHPQTLRYRLARLRELLGETLDDPDARFELEYALRAPQTHIYSGTRPSH